MRLEEHLSLELAAVVEEGEVAGTAAAQVALVAGVAEWVAGAEGTALRGAYSVSDRLCLP